MHNRLVATLLMIVVAATTLSASGPLRGVMSARLTRSLPDVEVLALRSPDGSEASSRLRALLHDALEARGYRIDPAARHALELRWRGPFWSDRTAQPRGELKGQGGSRSGTSLGYSIILLVPDRVQGAATYTIGLRLSDEAGEVWAGKAVAIARDMKPATIARALYRRLLDKLGEDVPETRFGGLQPRDD